MYEKHFGLKKRPFPALAQGTDVFVGPQSAAAMKAIKKALKPEDAVITVTGPAGSGKTAIARRALDGVGEARILVSIARIQLANDEILELLLAGLGAKQMPKSTVQRFAAFRRLLQQYAEQKKRVIVVVEDATRVGADALSELEALTAEDAGVSNGANIVLMGDTRLREFLREPKLARLKQRVRLRQKIEPLSDTELLAYLKHCLRLAGGEFESILAADAAQTLHSLSDGIPRVVNNVVEAAMSSAAENDEQRVSSALLARIANEEFGLTGQHQVAAVEALVAANDPGKEPIDTPEPEPEPEAESRPQPLAAAPAPAAEVDDEIPELIQDTLPDLEVLSAELAAAPEPALDAAVEAAAEIDVEENPEDTVTELSTLPELAADDDEELPTLYSSGRMEAPAAAEPQAEPESMPDVAAPQSEPVVTPEPVAVQPEPQPVAVEPVPEPEPVAVEPEPEPVAALVTPEAEVREVYAEEPVLEMPQEEVPEWERDPTLAELKPDLDALERAMAVAQGSEPQIEAPVEVAIEPEPEVEAEPEVVPEITLDRQIQEKIDEATEALEQTQRDALSDADSASAEAEAGATPEPAQQNLRDTTELQEIASGLARAKTIEDVDDKLAETLFGEELNLIAAQVIANAPPGYSANDDNEASEPAAAVPPVADLEGANALSLEPEPASEPVDANGNVDGSPSQRLATLRALNATAAPPGTPPTPEAGEAIVMAEDPLPVASQMPEDQPESIETQMDTSMTATLKALSVRPEDVPNDDDDDDDDKKGGFFSRFRKS